MIKRIGVALFTLAIATLGFCSSALAIETVGDETVITDPYCSAGNYWMVDSGGSLYRGNHTVPFEIEGNPVNVGYQKLWNTDIAASINKVYTIYGDPNHSMEDNKQLIRTLDLQTGVIKNVWFRFPKTDFFGQPIVYPKSDVFPNALSLLPDGSLMFGVWKMNHIFVLQKSEVDKAAGTETILQAKVVTANIDREMSDAGIIGSSGDFALDPDNPNGLYFLVAQQGVDYEYPARLVHLVKDRNGIYGNVKVLGKLVRENGADLTNVWGLTVANQKLITSDGDGKAYSFKVQPKATDSVDTKYELEELTDYRHDLYGAASSQEYISCSTTSINFVDTKGKAIGTTIRVVAPISTQVIDYQLPKCDVYAGCSWKTKKPLITRDGKSHTITLVALAKPVKIEKKQTAVLDTKTVEVKPIVLASTGTYAENILLSALAFILFGIGLISYRYCKIQLR